MICHIIPSKRTDQKRVAVCKCLSRKTKTKIQNKGKTIKEIKFNDNDIFINDHLSPKNRELFALASELRRNRQYKYLWTKNGSIHICVKLVTPE